MNSAKAREWAERLFRREDGEQTGRKAKMEYKFEVLSHSGKDRAFEALRLAEEAIARSIIVL